MWIFQLCRGLLSLLRRLAGLKTCCSFLLVAKMQVAKALARVSLALWLVELMEIRY